MYNFSFVFRQDPFLVSNPRGGVISNIKLIVELSKKGDVFILLPRDSFNYYTKNRSGINIKYIEFPMVRRGLGFSVNPKDVLAISELLCPKEKSVVFLGTKGSIPIAHKLTRLIPSRFFIITRDYNECIFLGKSYGKGSVKDFLRDVLMGKCWREAYIDSDLVIVNSNFLGRQIQKSHKVNRVEVLYPQVQAERCYVSDDMNRCKEKLNIGFISGPKYKGIQLVEELVKEYSDSEFHIFNSGKEKDKANVHYYGYKRQAEIFSCIDLLLIPSLWHEPYGRVATEAILSGVPVLHAPNGGLSEASMSSLFCVKSMSVMEWKKKINEYIEMQYFYAKEVERSASELRYRNSKEYSENRVNEILE